MNEANLAIARKVILCVGLLVAALLFLFPHWRVSVGILSGAQALEQDIGRGFIAIPPVQLTGGIAKIQIGSLQDIISVAYSGEIFPVAPGEALARMATGRGT